MLLNFVNSKIVLWKSKKILLLFLLIGFVSCTQKSFLCWNKERTKAKAFAFDEMSHFVRVEDIYRYDVLTSSTEPLQSHMPSGTHKLQMDKDFITLELIQDSAYAKTQLQSGQFVDSETAMSEEEYLKQTKYHAVYPVKWRYVFDKSSLTLSVSASPLPTPRNSTKAQFIYDETADEHFIRPVRSLTVKELSQIFPSQEYSYNATYPDCEGESYSLKRVFRFIIGLLVFP